MHNSDLDALVMLLFGLMAMLYLASRSLRARIRPRPRRRLPLNISQLRRIAYRKSVRLHLLFLPPALIFVYACHATGRMGLPGCMATLAILLALPLADVIFTLRLQRTPLRTLPAELLSAMERELAGKELVYSGGAWSYQDGSWYICVGRDICAVIWAGCIDFSVPMRKIAREWRATSNKGLNIKMNSI